MDIAVKKAKETNILQHLADILLAAKIPAVFIEDDDEKKELVHAVYYEKDNCPKMSSDYYFEKDVDFNDHIFVGIRTVISDVYNLNKNIDEDAILELLATYNYLIVDGSFILDGDNILYRTVSIIDDDISNNEIENQLIRVISTESAYVEEVCLSLLDSLKGE